jgi:hypothetical protein
MATVVEDPVSVETATVVLPMVTVVEDPVSVVTVIEVLLQVQRAATGSLHPSRTAMTSSRPPAPGDRKRIQIPSSGSRITRMTNRF